MTVRTMARPESDGAMPDGNSQSERELMEQLARGEQAALGELYLRYGRMVYSVLRRYTPGLPAPELEDLSQEVFLTVLDQAQRYQETGRLRSWLCGIAIRKARELRRKHWLRRTLLDRFMGTRDEPVSHPAAASDARLEVERALELLSAPQREVVLLSLVEQLSAEEVAEALGIRVNTVWTRLHRARQTLKSVLDKEEPGGVP